jgi:hypothetical protein
MATNEIRLQRHRDAKLIVAGGATGESPNDFGCWRTSRSKAHFSAAHPRAHPPAHHRVGTRRSSSEVLHEPHTASVPRPLASALPPAEPPTVPASGDMSADSPWGKNETQPDSYKPGPVAGVHDHRAPSGYKPDEAAGRGTCTMQPPRRCTTQCRRFAVEVPRNPLPLWVLMRPSG